MSYKDDFDKYAEYEEDYDYKVISKPKKSSKPKKFKPLSDDEDFSMKKDKATISYQRKQDRSFKNHE